MLWCFGYHLKAAQDQSQPEGVSASKPDYRRNGGFVQVFRATAPARKWLGWEKGGSVQVKSGQELTLDEVCGLETSVASHNSITGSENNCALMNGISR